MYQTQSTHTLGVFFPHISFFKGRMYSYMRHSTTSSWKEAELPTGHNLASGFIGYMADQTVLSMSDNGAEDWN